MDWAQLLVIILAVLLAIFLIIAITLAVLLVKITWQIKHMTDTAERTVHAVENTVSTFNNAALPSLIATKVLSQLINSKKDKKE